MKRVSFSDVANIELTEGNATNAQIVFMSSTSGGHLTDPENIAATIEYASVGFPNEELAHGDIILNTDSTQAWDNAERGSLAYASIMHELGHSLGLSHTNTENPNYNSTLDSVKYSVMSYETLAGMEPPGANNEVMPFGLQLLDIAALQEIYGGRNYSTRTGDTIYSSSTAFQSTRPNSAFIYTIWDGNGVDTIDASGYTTPQGSIIDLRQGEFSSIGYNAEAGAAVENVAIAYYTVIENATGTAFDDIIIGNAWNNIIRGGAGDDHLFGDGASVAENTTISQIKSYDIGPTEVEAESSNIHAAGNGSGNDIFFGGEGNDHIYGGSGTDTIDYSEDSINPRKTMTYKKSGTIGSQEMAMFFPEMSHQFLGEASKIMVRISGLSLRKRVARYTTVMTYRQGVTRLLAEPQGAIRRTHTGNRSIPHSHQSD